MKQNYKRSLLAAAVMAACSTAAQADFGISGNIELDTEYRNTDTAGTAVKSYSQGGRVEVNVTGETKMGDNFFRGKGSATIGDGGNTGAGDMFFQFGNSAWDLQVGVWEMENLFPLARDPLVLSTRVGSYQANRARGRIQNADGQIALHFKPSSAVSFELGTVWGDTSFGGAGEQAFGAIRPVVTFAAGPATIKVGMEKISGQNAAGADVRDETGIGATAGFNFGGANVNVNVASVEDDMPAATYETKTSIGANFIAGAFGGGVISTTAERAAGSDDEETSIYLTFTHGLFDIKSASLTYAVASATSDSATLGDDDVSGFKVRANYGF